MKTSNVQRNQFTVGNTSIDRGSRKSPPPGRGRIALTILGFAAVAAVSALNTPTGLRPTIAADQTQTLSGEVHRADIIDDIIDVINDLLGGGSGSGSGTGGTEDGGGGTPTP
jgi:hypothetical protein